MGKHPTEIKFPDQAHRFKEITERMYSIHLDKNADYSPSNVLVPGMGGVLVRMWDKLSRIYNLMGVPMPQLASAIREAECEIVDKLKLGIDDKVNKIETLKAIQTAFQKIYDAQMIDFSGLKNINDVNAANEPLVDSFEDLANYAVIGMLVMEKKWGK